MSGLRWIGEYTDVDADLRAPGMLGSISLTAFRGVAADGFMVRLGADREHLERRVLFKDRLTARVPGVGTATASAAMYGSYGDWHYVLENVGQSTLSMWRFDRRWLSRPDPYPQGEEIVCLTLNQYDPPSLLVYIPGDGTLWESEFADSPLAAMSPARRDTTGRIAALAESLRAAGAVWPTYQELGGEDQWVAYAEQHLPERDRAVFNAVGEHFGLSIDQATVEAGDLPLVVFPRDFE